MNVKRDEAEETIFQGTMIHPAVTVAKMTPRRMEMYLGKRETCGW
jgi:hypothetical protein